MASREVRGSPAVTPAPGAPAPPPETAPADVPAGSFLRRYWPAAIAAAAMLGLGLWGLGRASAMGNDEVATRWAASLSLGQLAHLLGNIDAVHGAYYLLMHAWTVVGTSPAVLRIPSVIAMAAAAALVAILGRQLTGSGWAGLLAGLVTAATPAMSYYAQTARSYALVFACVAAATVILVKALKSETSPSGAPGPAGPGAAGLGAAAARPWWLAYGALIMVSGYLNELALLVLTAHVVTVALARPGWPAVRRWAVAGAVGAVLVIPVVVVSSREADAVTWIARPDRGSLVLLFHDYFGIRSVIPALVLACIVIALLPPLRRGEAAAAWWRGGISVQSVAAPLMIIPAGLLIAESLVARPFYVDRYVLYGEIGAALLAAAGACRVGQWLRAGLRAGLRWPVLVAVPGVALLVCALVFQLGAQRFVRTPASRTFDFGGPSRFVGEHARPGDGVLYFGAFFRKASLGYPQDFRNVTDVGLAVSPRASGTFQGVNKPFSALAPEVLRYQRIWIVGQVPHPGRPLGLMRSESQEMLQDFTQEARARFHGITVTLWVQRPAAP
ncbi:MAG TPA: glycosyltransferase family 39 protein [Streptosporangiaceae bacterium]|jgi:mannosyltransferase